MTEQEFAKFAMGLKTYYPRENLLPNRPAMELWYRQLQDLPYEVAETALNKWVSTNKWSPSIAEIDVMLAMFGMEAVKHFCMCNAYKYRFRAGMKNGAEDIEKAEWYESKLIELRDGENE